MRVFLYAFFSLLLVACSTENSGLTNTQAVVVSISSDGQYVITSHRNNEIVLWEIPNQKRKVISKQGNIYSAYFIKRSHKFVWQDLSDIVHIQDIGGNEIESFKNTSTYGHVISPDLNNYISSDIGWSIYYGYGENLATIKKGEDKSFLGFGKLLNLTLSNDNHYLLMSGYGYEFDSKYTLAEEKNNRNHYQEMNGVVIWDVQSQKPIAKLPGNAAKTYCINPIA